MRCSQSCVSVGMVRYTNAHLYSNHKLLGTEEMIQWVRVTAFESPIHT